MKTEANQLSQVYAQFPSLKVNADRRALRAAATKVLGAGAAKKLLATFDDRDTYRAARTSALSSFAEVTAPDADQQLPRAVVSGLSTGGLLAAVVLARAGYRVDAFEARDSYVRNIQFSSRQALIDELASIDPLLSERFLEISSPMSQGFTYTVGGQTQRIERKLPHQGEPLDLPQTGEEMLADVTISVVECKVLEQVLFDYLKTQPHITIHRNSKLELGAQDAEGRYEVKGIGTPELVVVSEGSNSPTRKALGIENAVTSPGERIIAGVVAAPDGGNAAMRYDDKQLPDGSTERILKMAMGSAKTDMTWALIEVPVAFDPDPDPAEGLAPDSEYFSEAQQEAIDDQFREEAALVMARDLDDVELEGPFQKAHSHPSLFTLQQTMSKSAVAGTNVVGLGDFVGTGHFLVGGGMATASVSHIERLKALVFDLELGTDKAAALRKYEQGVIADTLAWGRRGIAEMYPDLLETAVSDAYVAAVTEWISGKNKDPLAALEKLLAPLSEALPPIGKPATT
ncbi:MAG: hypothetical protein IPJ65_00385 [Archangiaceae bacterium]|nr:hypothetical protein [Archangiaceae bacterium]